MASFRIPAPPYSDLLERLFSTQQQDLHLDSTNEFSDDVRLAQRVPETPTLQSISTSVPRTENLHLELSFANPELPSGREHVKLRSVAEIPERYRTVFKEFTHFNFVQSKVLDDILYTDASVVVSAPTGSGKTTVFELAILRLLMQLGETVHAAKVIYVAPIKALCTERYEDWQAKFGPLGLQCCELTGDTQLDDYAELQNAHIIATTPEKWDSMTRRWRDNKALVQMVRLFLIDEVHQLNDETRGATMEAIVSRMKTVTASVTDKRDSQLLRFVAVSATIPNIVDIAAWLGTEEHPSLQYLIDETHRPVRLRRVVLGYPDATTEFKFDLTLNYKISGIIQCYSEQKPTLVFCATRKGTQQAASTLAKDARFVMNAEHKQRLHITANSLRDSKLRDLAIHGMGYHHAGMDVSDRKTMEAMFVAGDLPVLFATSTLAMGVNLPAHLVVIKSTLHYANGMYQEYSESQVLQMIGRAGRPQFDTTATAVIMTRNSTKGRYEALLKGTQVIESSLHKNLIEHLNAEIVLHTISDVSIAIEWLKSTYLYIRIKQNPKHYGIPDEKEKLEVRLQEMCLKDLKLLENHSLLKIEDQHYLKPTDTGCLMARYCVAFDSMKIFLGLKGTEGLAELVSAISKCREFEDVHLRVNEKRVLNSLNKDKNRLTIRFPMDNKIKSTDMKVNCLIQAALGCLSVQEFALSQDTQKILRAASRLSKCYMELQLSTSNSFNALVMAVTLHKCIYARLWENSKYVAKQLDKIGLALSTTLVNAGLTDFAKLQDTNPRELELIMNRHPPFGNQIRDAVAKLPQYALSVQQSTPYSSHQAQLTVTVSLVNHVLLKESGSTAGPNHACALLVGNADHAICKQKINDFQLMSTGTFTRKFDVHRSDGSPIELKICLISLEYVGLDVQELYTPHYLETGTKLTTAAPKVQSVSVPPTPANSKGRKSGSFKSCSHRCLNKEICGHECCRRGVSIRGATDSSTPSAVQVPSSGDKHSLGGYLNDLHARDRSIVVTPAVKRLKMQPSSVTTSNFLDASSLMDKFSYVPKQQISDQQKREVPRSGSNPARVQDTDGAHSGDEYDYRQLCDFLLDHSPASKSSDDDLPFIPITSTYHKPTSATAYNPTITTTTTTTPSTAAGTAIPSDSYRFTISKDTQWSEPTAVIGPQCRPVVTSCGTLPPASCLHTASRKGFDIPKRTPLEPMPRRIPLEPILGRTPLEPMPRRIPLEPILGRTPLEPILGRTPLEPIQGRTPLEPMPRRTPLDPMPRRTPLDPMPRRTPLDLISSSSEISLTPSAHLKLPLTRQSEKENGQKHSYQKQSEATETSKQSFVTANNASLCGSSKRYSALQHSDRSAPSCSFFNSGPTSDDEDNDLYNCVFTGIF